MKQIIQFHVYRGETGFVAEAVDLPIVTQAATLDELANNIQEATELHLSDEDLSDFNLAPHPTLQVNLELQPFAYA